MYTDLIWQCYGYVRRFIFFFFQKKKLQHLWLSNKPTGTDEIPFSYRIFTFFTYIWLLLLFRFELLAVVIVRLMCRVVAHVHSIHVCRLWLLCFFHVVAFHLFRVWNSFFFRHLCTYYYNVGWCVCVCVCCIPFRSFCFGPFLHKYILFCEKKTRMNKRE